MTQHIYPLKADTEVGETLTLHTRNALLPAPLATLKYRLTKKLLPIPQGLRVCSDHGCNRFDAGQWQPRKLRGGGERLHQTPGRRRHLMP